MINLVKYLNESLITKSFKSKQIQKLFNALKYFFNHPKYKFQKNCYNKLLQWDKITDENITLYNAKDTSYASIGDLVDSVVSDVMFNRKIVVSYKTVNNEMMVEGLVWSELDAYLANTAETDYSYNHNNQKDMEERLYQVMKDKNVMVIDIAGLDTQDIHDKKGLN